MMQKSVLFGTGLGLVFGTLIGAVLGMLIGVLIPTSPRMSANTQGMSVLDALMLGRGKTSRAARSTKEINCATGIFIP
jgi:hypothetical protein